MHGKDYKPRVHSRRYSQETNLASGYTDDSQVLATRVRINVSGNVYETLESTLARYPSTLLGCPSKRNLFFDSKRQEYFFDRNRNAFDAILFYYQSRGILSCPSNVRMDDFVEELVYFGFSEELLIKFLRHEGINFNAEEPHQEEPEMPKNKVLRIIWQCFEQPKSSRVATIVAWLTVAFISLSIVIICAETIPPDDKDKQLYSNVYNDLETMCVAWFTIELLLRFISAPNKLRFAKDSLNLVDFVAILPFYLGLIVDKSSSALKSFRLLRVCRLFKLFRHSSGLKILSKTVQATWPELLMIVFFAGISTVILAGILFYAEYQAQQDMFSSIPAASWFVIISLTNVGYGDMVPITVPGRFVGSMCALVGVLVLALPSPVIARKFKQFYEEAKENAAKERRERKSPPRDLPPLPTQSTVHEP